jgi:hypothetical protein
MNDDDMLDLLERLVKVEGKAAESERRLNSINGQISRVHDSLRSVDLKVDTIINNQRLATGIAEALEDSRSRRWTKREKRLAAAAAVVAAFAPIAALVIPHA